MYLFVGKRRTTLFFTLGGVRDSLDEDSMGTAGSVVFGVSAVVAVPFGAVAALLALPAVLSSVISDKFTERNRKKKYMKQKAQFMMKWTDEHLNNIRANETMIYDYILESYFKVFENQISEICDKKIPAIIASDSIQVQKIHSDHRTAKDILQDYQLIQLRLDTIFGKLRLYGLRYFDDSFNFLSIDSITMDTDIEIGQFSTVYRVSLHQQDDPRKAMLKVMGHSNRGSELFNSLNEVDCLRYGNNHKLIHTIVSKI